jgi:NAD(P)H-dependent flavin oxidoreductase YrpB (nitropropane dioxygenase family)
LVTTECPIHDNLKRALASATELDTLPILGTLRNTVRAWKNTAALKVAELESKQAELGEILSVVAGTATKRMYEGGDLDAGVIPCSQSIGRVHEIKPVAEVIDGIMQEASKTLGRLPK